jgi:hypothetical protein
LLALRLSPADAAKERVFGDRGPYHLGRSKDSERRPTTVIRQFDCRAL